MRSLVAMTAVALSCSCAACDSTRAPTPTPTPTPTPSPPSHASLVASRPYAMHVPPTHDARAPLFVLLHGFGGEHAGLDRFLGTSDLADEHGFFLALPDGVMTSNGERFWNATDACCDFRASHVDDVAYLDAILDDAIARYPVDPARVYVGGYSNGGFMAHRYACDRAERVAAIVSFAGDPWKDASRCKPGAPVSVLQVHGDADAMVHYGGARLYDNPAFHRAEYEEVGAYPAARDGIAMWSRLDRCPESTRTDDPRQEILRYTGCASGSEVQLWTWHGAGHTLPLRRDDMERVWAFLSAHARAK